MNFNLPLLTVIIPFLLAIAVVSFVKERFNRAQQLRLIMVIIFVVAIVMACLLGLMLFEILKGNTIHSAFLTQMAPFGLRLQVDGLSIVMALIGFFL